MFFLVKALNYFDEGTNCFRSTIPWNHFKTFNTSMHWANFAHFFSFKSVTTGYYLSNAQFKGNWFFNRIHNPNYDTKFALLDGRMRAFDKD